MSTKIAINNIATGIAALFAKEYEVDQDGVMKMVRDYLLECPPEMFVVKAAKTKAKPATERKPRRNSAEEKEKAFLEENSNKVVVVEHTTKPCFVSFNGHRKALGNEIKKAFPGQGISAREDKIFGHGISIPNKNFAGLKDVLLKFLSDNDTEYVCHTIDDSKTTRAPSEYNLFMKKKREEDPSLTISEIAKLWGDSDEKKASEAKKAEKVAAKKAEKEAEKEAKKTEKEAEKEKAAAAKNTEEKEKKEEKKEDEKKKPVKK